MWLGRVQPPHPNAVPGSAPALQPFPCLALRSSSWSRTSEPAGLGGLWDWEQLGPASAEPQNVWAGKARDPGTARAPTGREEAEEMGRKIGEMVKRSTWMEQGRGMQGSVPSLAFLSPSPQEHDGGWWHPLGSPRAAPLLYPILVLAARWGRAAFGVALPALRAVQCRGVQQDGASEGVPAAWLCCFPLHPSALVCLCLRAHGARVLGPFPTCALPSSLAANPPAL